MTRDQLIETMARAADPDTWDAKYDNWYDIGKVREKALANARAALTAIEAAGMRMVPVEALQEIARQRLYSEAAQEDSTSE